MVCTCHWCTLTPYYSQPFNWHTPVQYELSSELLMTVVQTRERERMQYHMSHDVTQCHMMSDDVTSFVCSEDYQTLDFQSSSFGKTPPLWWAFKHKDSFPPLVSTLLCRFSYFAKHHWGGVLPKELDWKSKVWICIDGLWHNYLIQQSTWL